MEEKELTSWMKNQEAINERMITALERLTGSNNMQEISEHLKNCPNCQNAISEIVKKKFDVEDLEEDEDW